MKAEELRRSVLQLAVEGKLVEQRPEEGTAKELLAEIAAERERLVREGKMKKGKPLAPVSPNEVPFEIPENWEWVRLGSVTNIIMGQSPSGSSVGLTKSGIEFHQGKIYFSEKYLLKSPVFTEEILKISPPMSVLLSVRAPVGAVNITDREVGIGRGLCAICPLCSVSPDYYYHVLRSLVDNISSKATGSTFKAITLDIVMNQLIPLPPLAEQRRIVARLEELMPLIDAYDAEERRLSALETEFPEQLRRSLLQYAVEGKLVEQRPEEGTARELLAEIAAERERLIREGKMKRSKPLAPVSPDEVPFEIPKSWEWVRLGDLVSKIGSGSTPTGGKAIYLKTGIPFIRSQNVYNDGLRLDDVAYISAEINLKMSGTVVHPKDILLNITGASIGRCALVPDNFVQGNVNQHVLILRPVLTDVREYLHRYITSPVFQNRIMDEQIGVSREGISAEKLKKFIIPLPPLAEQRRIVARLEELMPLITTLTSIKKPLL